MGETKSGKQFSRENSKNELSAQSSFLEEKLPPRKVDFHDLFDGGWFSVQSMGLLKEKLSKQENLQHKTALVVVHPLYFESSDEIVNDVPELKQRYQEYLQSLQSLIKKCQDNNIPVIFFLSSPEKMKSDLDPYSYDDNSSARRGSGYETQINTQLVEFKKTLQDVFQINDGDFFVVVTQPNNPDPLLDSRHQAEVVFKPTEFAETEGLREFYGQDLAIPQDDTAEYFEYTQLVMAAFWKRLVTGEDDEAKLERVLLAGSYFGGQVEGFELAKRTQRVITQGGLAYNYEVTSNRYTPVEKKQDGLWKIDVRPYLLGRKHPLQHISVRGCSAYLMRNLYQARLKVGITNATYPEELPRVSELSQILDDGNGAYIKAK